MARKSKLKHRSFKKRDEFEDDWSKKQYHCTECRWHGVIKSPYHEKRCPQCGDTTLRIGKRKVKENGSGFSWKNPLGVPWWIWLGVGAGALYFFTRSKAQAAILPQDAAASALQSQLNTAITAALGYQAGDVLNISFPSVNSGPVRVIDNKSGKLVLQTIQSPTTLLKFVVGGGLDKYYNQDIADPYASTGWQKATIVV